MGKGKKILQVAPAELDILLFILGNKNKEDAIHIYETYPHYIDLEKTSINKEKEKELIKTSSKPPFITPISFIKRYFKDYDEKAKGKRLKHFGKYGSGTVDRCLKHLFDAKVLKRERGIYYSDSDCIVPLLHNFVKKYKCVERLHETKYFKEYKEDIEIFITKELEYYWKMGKDISKKEWLKLNAKEIREKTSKFGNFISAIGIDNLLKDNILLDDLFSRGDLIVAMEEKYLHFKQIIRKQGLSTKIAKDFINICFEITYTTRNTDKLIEGEYLTDFKERLSKLITDIKISKKPTKSK